MDVHVPTNVSATCPYEEPGRVLVASKLELTVCTHVRKLPAPEGLPVSSG